jgi:hypothetical protein
MKFASFLCILFALLIASCNTSVRAFSDYDKAVNISGLTTYNWLSEQEIEERGNNPLYYNELNDKRIKSAVDEQLQKRGFIVSDGSQPLQLHYHLIIEDKTLLTSEPTEYSYTPFRQFKSTQEYPYKQGTLIIDLMDNRSKTLVWRGWATSAIELEIKKSPEQAIQKGVEKIFKLFPYNNSKR